jgi:hypothetical protein
MFEYSMIKVKRDKFGTFHYDFSIMQRYIDLCFKYGINKEIEVFGIINIWVDYEEGYCRVANDYSDAVRLRYLDEQDVCYKYMDNSKDIKTYISAIEQYFVNNDLINIVRVTADEPADAELYKERLEIIRQIAPQFKYKAAIAHAEFIKEFNNVEFDFVPILSCVSNEWNEIQKFRKESTARFLWYVCCQPKYPNNWISSHLLESRFMGYLTEYIGFDGFLRWDYTAWPEHPRQRISYNSPFFAAGDCNFVYPANNGKPLLSLRYKNLKRGIEEYGLIQLLKKNSINADEIIKAIFDKIFIQKDITKYYEKGNEIEDIMSVSHHDFEFARKLLLQSLEIENIGGTT